ncbi:hypothetical protein [Acidovorax phage AP1]|nr:hypothetical protein [Acidovorax phage AP1]
MTKFLQVARIARFVCSCIRLRSVRLALWLDQYDNHNPKF